MAQALHTSLATGGLTQGGLRPGLGNDNIFVTSSLDLNFAMTKSLGGLVTFTRASSGTYVGSDGLLKTATNDVPRFDHNPTTGESLGLLVEEQRTNLLVQSEDFATTWTINNTTVSTNQITAPDGFTTADRIVETATTAEHNARQDTTSQPASTYTASIFAKAGERDVLQFVTTGVLGGQRANFDLTNGVVGSVDAQITARIIPYPGGWYRCVATATSTVSGTLRAQWNIVTSATATRAQVYAGDITKGLYLWGAMIEAGAFPTSYIPTTTATATRSADVASITGTNFSSWYRQDEGTVFADATVLSTSKANQTISFNDSTLNNRFELRLIGAADTYRTDCVAGGVTKFSNQNFASSGTRRIAALAVKANDFRLQSGASGISPASDAVPTVDRLYLNYATFAGGEINGTIRRLCYWGQRLPNSTLQAITQ